MYKDIEIETFESYNTTLRTFSYLMNTTETDMFSINNVVLNSFNYHNALDIEWKIDFIGTTTTNDNTT